MMRTARRIIAALAAAMAGTAVHAANLDPPGLRLGDVVKPLAYQLRLAVDPAQARFEGEVRIDLMAGRPTDVIWMNSQGLDIDDASFVQGELPIRVKVHHAGEDLVGFEAVDAQFLFGNTTATIRYHGPLEPNSTRGLFRREEAGKWYVISQFEALSARRAMPSFDEPGWKTPWEITVDTPAANVVTSNTPELASEDVAGRPGWKRHRFAKTRPLPTYLVAVAIGPFAIVDGGTSGASRTPLRYAAPEGAGAQARFAVSATPRVLDLLESYFGTPFPFGKLDSVSIPSTVGFGAMENAGMITYARRLLLARPSDDSIAFQRAYVSVGAHEMAHQWFGDLVTTAWWDDIWLNEALATWMARKIVGEYRPQWDQGWRHGETRRRALSSDRLTTARQIRNPVRDKNDIYGAFDGITYQKGAEVLSMFEAWMGEEAFRKGVRDYLARHADANATSEDFVRSISEASGKPGRAAAGLRSFVEQAGLPLVDVSLACTAGSASVRLAQHRFVSKGQSASPQHWITPACFTYRASGKAQKQCVELEGEATVPLHGDACPDWIVGNAGGAGHWVARYDATLLRGLDARVVDIPEDEAVALAGDTELLVSSGLLGRDEGFRIASALLRHPSLGARHGGVYFMEKQRDEMLSAVQRQARHALLVSYIQPMARSLGWTDRPKDDLATQDLRALVMPYAARMDAGEALRGPARDLALGWLDDRASLPASSIDAVLQTAARYADASTFERFHGALVRTTQPNERTHLVKAMAAVRDPALRARGLDMTLRAETAEGLDSHDALELMQAMLQDDANRAAAFAFLRTHWDALLARFPEEGMSELFPALADLCTRRERDEFVAFFAPRAPSLQAGPRRYAQALEAIEVCVAASSAGEGPAAPRAKATTRRPRRGR